jgi:hypothetical protein
MENGSIQTKSMGLAERFLNIFVSPTETFESVTKKPAWWLPFIICVIIGIGSQFLLMDITKSDQQKAMTAQLQKQGKTDQEIQEIQQQMESGPGAFFVKAGPIIGIVLTPFIIAGIWALIALLLRVGSNSMVGGKADYSPVLGVVAWSSIVGLLGDLLKIFLVSRQGTSIGVTTSLASLMRPILITEKPTALYYVLYTFMSKMNPFTIWQVVLWGLGLAVVAKIKPNKGLIVSFALWAAWTVLSLGLGTLFQALSKNFA